jgi:glutamine amidotransferase
MRVIVFDYGAGNLHSLGKVLVADGRAVRVESDAARLTDGDLLVLPGVGAFAQAAARLASARESIRDALRNGHPCLGICLGAQLLLDASEEGPGDGLGLIPGRVTRLRATRVPHIGWNDVSGPEPLLAASNLELACFANGYACRPERAGYVTAWCRHEDDRFPAVLRVARTIGVQFHPEKSGAAGRRFVAAALEAVMERSL